MEQAKRRKVEMIVGLVLVVLAFLGNGYALMNQPNGQKGIAIIPLIFISIALIFAGIYVGTEFKKSSAKLYKLFLYVFALKHLTGVLTSIDLKSPLFLIISDLIVFVLVNILLWVDDLGKMKSVILSTLVFAVGLFLFVVNSFISPPVGAVNASISLNWVLIGLASTVLPLILVMMVHLKYVDKEMRKGSK